MAQQLLASVDEALGVVASQTGFPIDQVRYVTWYELLLASLPSAHSNALSSMLLMIVAAVPYRLLPGIAVKHIFSVRNRRACAVAHLIDRFEHLGVYLLPGKSLLAALVWNIIGGLHVDARVPEHVSCALQSNLR